MTHRLVLLHAFLAACSSTSQERSRTCAIDEGDYEAWLPADWDGTSPLPAFLYIHGYGGSPAQLSGDDAAMASLSEAGMLVLIPESSNGSWDVRLSSETRDDLGFFIAILDVAESCWGVDESRIYVSGFSIGGSMAHQLACNHDAVTAAAPISGTFWNPIPESCPVSPIPIRHTHGLSDSTWPYEGQQFSPDAVQGAAEDGVALWLAHNNAPDVTTTETDGEETCTVWGAGEAEVRLCTHDGGHTRVDGWADRLIDWFDAVR
ncbi:MAG: polyhydroxybutyrate depolymerase [Myxococcota bacterium]|jgi:polyhydroxybutyrate depolymerase